MLKEYCLCGCFKEPCGPKGYTRGHWSRRKEDRNKISQTLLCQNKYDLNDKRVCGGCNKEKCVSEFHGKSRGKFCSVCRKTRNDLVNRSRTKEEMKSSFIKSKYGITLDEYKKMWDEQKGLCAICNKPETRKSRYGGICLLHIDHDHETNNVRGLLCNLCNKALGYFRDNPQLIRNGLNYLIKFKKEI